MPDRPYVLLSCSYGVDREDTLKKLRTKCRKLVAADQNGKGGSPGVCAGQVAYAAAQHKSEITTGIQISVTLCRQSLFAGTYSCDLTGTHALLVISSSPPCLPALMPP